MSGDRTNTTMNRREFLSRGGAGVVGVSLLGGCTDQNLSEAEREPAFVDEPVAEEEADLPVEQRLGVAAEAIREADGADVGDVDALESFLEERDLTVESLEEKTDEFEGEEADPEVEVSEHDPVVALEYVHEASAGLVRPLGLVAGGYARFVEAGTESRKLHTTRLTEEGEEFGEFEVRTHWAEEYNAGAYSAREYAAEVLESAETSHETPTGSTATPG